MLQLVHNDLLKTTECLLSSYHLSVYYILLKVLKVAVVCLFEAAECLKLLFSGMLQTGKSLKMIIS